MDIISASALSGFQDRTAAAGEAFDPVFQQGAFLQAALGSDGARSLAQQQHEQKMRRLGAVMARLRQQASAGTSRGVDGLGTCQWRIPASLLAEVRQRFGADCFDSADFRRDFAKEFPGCVVRYEKKGNVVTMPRSLSQARPAASGGIILVP